MDGGSPVEIMMRKPFYDDVGMDDNFLLDGPDVPTPKPLKKTVNIQADTTDEEAPIEIIDDNYETPRALKLKSRNSWSRKVVISTDEEDDAVSDNKARKNGDLEFDTQNSDSLSDLVSELQEMIKKKSHGQKGAGGKKKKRVFRAEVQEARAVSPIKSKVTCL